MVHSRRATMPLADERALKSTPQGFKPLNPCSQSENPLRQPPCSHDWNLEPIINRTPPLSSKKFHPMTRSHHVQQWQQKSPSKRAGEGLCGTKEDVAGLNLWNRCGHGWPCWVLGYFWLEVLYLCWRFYLIITIIHPNPKAHIREKSQWDCYNPK